MRAAEARSLSIAGVVSKPAKPSGLADVVGTALGLRSATLRQQRASTADPGMATRHPLRILLAEDNAVNQMLAGRLLAQLGYRMDVAGDGEEAIQAVERQTYDLVLMDVQMPNLDGLEATRRIVARWPAGERPRIVAMTGNAMSEDRAACFAAGMDGYIAKPIRPAELLAELEATPALAVATASPAPPAGPGPPMPDRPATDELAAAKARIAELEVLEAERARAIAVQAALYRIAEAASAADDMPAFYRTIHEIVGELMYAENLYIALYDDEREPHELPLLRRPR